MTSMHPPEQQALKTVELLLRNKASNKAQAASLGSLRLHVHSTQHRQGRGGTRCSEEIAKTCTW